MYILGKIKTENFPLFFEEEDRENVNNEYIYIIAGSDGVPYEYTKDMINNLFISDFYYPNEDNPEGGNFNGWGNTYEYSTYPIRLEDIDDLYLVKDKSYLDTLIKENFANLDENINNDIVIKIEK